MIPAYHDLQAGDSGDRYVAGVVPFLGGDDARLQVSLGQFFAFVAQLLGGWRERVDLAHHAHCCRLGRQRDLFKNDGGNVGRGRKQMGRI
jgi:hypothetical protein